MMRSSVLVVLSMLLASSISLCIAAPSDPQYHHPQQFLDSLQGKASRIVGKAIVEHYCSSCHSKKPEIPLGAPRIGVKTEWQARMKLRDSKQMLAKIDQGFNAMPPRGGCFECSDEQLLAAIKYLLPQPLTKIKRK